MLLYVTEPIVPDVSKYCIVFVFRVRLSKKTGLLSPEFERTAPLRNVGNHSSSGTALHAGRLGSSSKNDIYNKKSGFGGLEVACWPLVPKFAGSHTAEAFGFLGRKNPQHAVGPMS